MENVVNEIVKLAFLVNENVRAYDDDLLETFLRAKEQYEKVKELMSVYNE